MFPQFREQIGTALDLIVEFATLGEYRMGIDTVPGAPGAPAVAPGHAPQLGGAGDRAVRAAVRHTVAGGATGYVPVATPAARRLRAGGGYAAPRGTRAIRLPSESWNIHHQPDSCRTGICGKSTQHALTTSCVRGRSSH